MEGMATTSDDPCLLISDKYGIWIRLSWLECDQTNAWLAECVTDPQMDKHRTQKAVIVAVKNAWILFVGRRCE